MAYKDEARKILKQHDWDSSWTQSAVDENYASQKDRNKYFETKREQAVNSLVELHEKYEKETMERFGIKKGVEYRVHASDKAIILENRKYIDPPESIRKKAGL